MAEGGEAAQEQSNTPDPAIGAVGGIDAAAELERIAQAEREAKEAEAPVEVEPSPYDKYFQRLHPFGWVALGFALVAVVATIAGSNWLVGRMPIGLWILTILVIVCAAVPKFFHVVRLGIEKVSDAAGVVAKILVWAVFLLQFVNVVTRYTNDWFEQDILFGQVASASRFGFALIFLIGVGYGVKAQVNPRIDFWWAEFSTRKKAWLDFTMHTFFFLPFLILAMRMLVPYSAFALGRRRNDGSWPEGLAVWRTWNGPESAGELPLGPINAFILIGFVLWTAQVVAEIIKSGYVLAGREDLGDVRVSDVPLRIE